MHLFFSFAMARDFIWSPYFKTSYDPLRAGSIDGTDEIPHDRAISKALTAKYKTNKCVTGDSKCTLFIGKLNSCTTEKTLSKEFSRYGVIHRVRVVRDIVTGTSKKYAFVEFEKDNYAQRAWEYMHNANIDDNNILVEFEFERTMKGWVPRRLGGGLSGQRESGQLRFGGRDKPFMKPIIINDNKYQLPRDGSRDTDQNSYQDNKDSTSHSRHHDDKKLRKRSRSPGEKYVGRDSYVKRSTRQRSIERHPRRRERRSKSREKHYRRSERRSRSRDIMSRSRERRSRSRERRSKSRERDRDRQSINQDKQAKSGNEQLRRRDSSTVNDDSYKKRKGRF